MTNYLIRIDRTVYEPGPAGPRPAQRGSSRYFTLAEALRETYGCGNAHILREDADGAIVTVVRDAGRAFTDLTHEPTGQKIPRNRRRRYVGLSLGWKARNGWTGHHVDGQIVFRPPSAAAALVVARRVKQTEAKRHFEAGGSVVVCEYGGKPTRVVSRNTTTHSSATTTWPELVAEVRMWRGRYPNQRFYVI